MQESKKIYDSLTAYWRDTRRLKGLALPSIAEATGFHTSNLSRVERSVHRPTVDTLDRLSAPSAYGCPWWSYSENQIFVRAFAYYLTKSALYAPRDLEWWPPDMQGAVAAASVIASGSTWSHSVRMPSLVEVWPALGLPGWVPSTEQSNEPPPAVTGPLWLWGAWSIVREFALKKDSSEDVTPEEIAWYQNIHGRDDTDLVTVVLGYLLETSARLRIEHSEPVESGYPMDPDFRAIASKWPSLSAARRRLAREMVESWGDVP